jgi:hypothetical protein
MNKKRVKKLEEEFFEKFGPAVGCVRKGNEIIEINAFRKYKKAYTAGRKRK